MLLESMIDHEYPQTMKMEVEAPTVRTGQRLPAWTIPGIFKLCPDSVMRILTPLRVAGGHVLGGNGDAGATHACA